MQALQFGALLTDPKLLQQLINNAMTKLAIEELPYAVDSAKLFSRLLDMDAAVFLDSSAPYSSRGRYDILVAQPRKMVPLPKHGASGAEFFKQLRAAINETTPPLNNDHHLPFLGGAVGFFSYDLARSLEKLPQQAIADIELPPAQVGIYSWAVIVDHRQQRTVLVAHPCTPTAELTDIKRRLQQSTSSSGSDFALKSRFQSNFSKSQYQHAFMEVQRYIQAGDCYQINLAQRYSSAFEGDPWQAYLALRAVAGAPFSAYLNFDKQTIMSLSPERFLHVMNQRVTTSPIKGTRKRGATPEADNFLARQLQRSSKDRAENLMIVDLLRNDLGKVCIPGSIQVDELFELQSFETVHHLVSTISGQLQPKYDALDLLCNSFPGGSITGAPKIRAMEIIEELEPHRRSAYCGSIGYISCDGQMDTNIAIRTLVCNGESIHCWAGGGIVADSECESEYEECMNKVGPLLRTLEQMGMGR